MNKVILIGRIAHDLELKGTPPSQVVNFNLAVNRGFRNSKGEIETDFIPIVVWDRGNFKQATNLVKYNKKGAKIAVEGMLQKRNYVNSEGIKVWITEVVADRVEYLEPRKQDSEPTGHVEGRTNAEYLSGFPHGELPF